MGSRWVKSIARLLNIHSLYPYYLLSSVLWQALQKKFYLCKYFCINAKELTIRVHIVRAVPVTLIHSE